MSKRKKKKKRVLKRTRRTEASIKAFEERTLRDVRPQSSEDVTLIGEMERMIGLNDVMVLAHDYDWKNEEVVSQLDETDYAIVTIQRSDVETLNISMITDVLRMGDKLIGSLLVSVSGYQYDNRELINIPEFQLWCRKLYAECPQWPHLLSRDYDDFIKAYFGALSVEASWIGEQATQIYALRSTKLQEHILGSLLTDAFTLNQFGVSEEAAEIINRGFIDWSIGAINKE